MDSTYENEALYLFGAEGPVEVPNGGELQLEVAPPLQFFYVLRNNAGDPTGGAIAVARTYHFDYPSGTSGLIEVWKNVPEKQGIFNLSHRAYVEFHANWANRNQNPRQWLHLDYHDGSGRSDDSIIKRRVLLPQSSEQGWQCPTSADATFTCKIMIQRYRGVNGDGNCMDFTLLEGAERELAGSLRSLGIRIIELDHENGPTPTYVGRVTFR